MGNKFRLFLQKKVVRLLFACCILTTVFYFDSKSFIGRSSASVLDPDYTQHFQQGDVALDIYVNIVTAGIHVTKSNINPSSISARYKENSSSQWIVAHSFSVVNNKANNLAITSLFNLKGNTRYDLEVTVGATIFNTSFTTQPDEFIFTPKRVFYVNKAALDGGDGSSANPFNSIQAAVDVAQAGDRILVSEGVYYEHIELKASGSQYNWIQILAHGNVIMDGSHETFKLEDQTGWKHWTNYPSCAYPIDSNLLWELDLSGNSILDSTPFYSIIRDERAFFNYETEERGDAGINRLNSLRNVAIGVRCRAGECYRVEEGFYFDTQTNKLYIRSLDHPSNHQYRLPITGASFMFNGNDWIWIEGFQFRYNRANDYKGGGAIYMNNGVDHSIIRNNKFVNSGRAIRLYTPYDGDNILDSGGSFNRIEFNEITYPNVGDLRYQLTKNNKMRGFPIEIIGGMMNIIRDNNIYDSYLGIAGYSDDYLKAGFVKYHQYEVDIYNNIVNKISSASIGIQNQWVNVRVFNNVMKDGHVGFAMLDVTAGPIWYVRNTLHNGDGDPFKRYVLTGEEPPTFFYHNNVLRTNIRYDYLCNGERNLNEEKLCNDANFDWTASWDSGADCQYVHYIWGSAARFKVNAPTFKFRNNAFLSTNYSTMTASYSTSNRLMDLDYNSYWRGGTVTDWFPGIALINSTYYYNVSDLYTQFGIEEHGVQVYPNFVDIENFNYDLQANSELIDRGEYIPGINDAYKGTAPDIGAREYGSDVDIYDLNLDGQVNPLDLKELLLSWNKRAVGLQADFNDDEVVNIMDYSSLLVNISQ